MTMNLLHRFGRKNRRTSVEQAQPAEASPATVSAERSHRHSWLSNRTRRRRKRETDFVSSKQVDSADGTTKTHASAADDLTVPFSATTSVSNSSQSPESSPVSAMVKNIPFFVEEEKDPAVQSALRHRYSCPHNGHTGSCTCLQDDEDFQNKLTKAVTALDKSGNDCFAAGDYDQAFMRYERALLLKRTTLKNVKEEEAKADFGMEETAEQRASIMASVATSINNMTYLKQRAGLATTEETMASYLKSLQMKREILGPAHLSVGKTLNNIGSVFYLKKEYEPALKAYTDAYQIMEQQLGPEHCDVGTVLSNIGDVYFATDQKKEALSNYRSALDIRWVKLGQYDPKVNRLMRQIASLETGRQPEKDDDDVSESETFMDGDLRESFLHESCQNLSEEIDEDMKYFDLVEREMAISMVKDKIRIFREMRDLYKEDEDASGGGIDLVSLDNTPTSGVDPDATSPQTFDLSDVSYSSHSGAFDEMMLPFSLTRALEDADPSESPEVVKEEAEVATEGEESQVQPLETTVRVSVLSTSEPDAQRDQPVPAASFPSTKTPVSHSALPSSAMLGPAKSMISPVSSRSASERYTYKASPSPCLSIEDRKKALVSVRERLTRLRAERSSFSESSEDSILKQVSDLPLTNTKKKSYMFPTIASAAKVAVPTTTT